MVKTCYDLYNMEDVPIQEFLLQDENNVIFNIDKESLGINRAFLKLSKSFIFWSCEMMPKGSSSRRILGTPISHEPLQKFVSLLLRNATFVEFNDIDFVLKRDVRNISLVFDHIEPKLQSNSVFEAKLGAGVSGKHCQSTSAEKIYRVSSTTMKIALKADKLDKNKQKIALKQYLTQEKSKSKSQTKSKSSSKSKSRSGGISSYESKYDVSVQPREKLFNKSGRLRKN